MLNALMLVKVGFRAGGVLVVVNQLCVGIAPDFIHDSQPVTSPDLVDVFFLIATRKQRIGQIKQRVRELDSLGIVIVCRTRRFIVCGCFMVSIFICGLLSLFSGK